LKHNVLKLVIPDCCASRKSGIHAPRSANMDSGLAANQVGCCRLGH
jgi:hypothetical protein